MSNTISFNTEVSVIPDFFYLSNVHNEGGAWSLFSGNVPILIVVAILALVFIFYTFIKDKQLYKTEIVIVTMLIGGIMGNLVDRIIWGYVIDYLGFIIFGYYFPIFNLADIFIVISIGLMLITTIKEEVLCKRLESKTQ
jgi:signal peptidase II